MDLCMAQQSCTSWCRQGPAFITGRPDPRGLLQAYQYFNWRRDSTNDLVLFVLLNFTLLLLGSAIKARLVGPCFCL